MGLGTGGQVPELGQMGSERERFFYFERDVCIERDLVTRPPVVSLHSHLFIVSNTSPDALFPQRGREMLFTLPAFPTCHTHTFRLSPSMNGCVEAHLPALPILRADVFSHTLPSFAHDCFLLSCFFLLSQASVVRIPTLCTRRARRVVAPVGKTPPICWARPTCTSATGNGTRSMCVFFNSERRPPFCHITHPVLAICQRN